MPRKHKDSDMIATILGTKLRAARLARGLKQEDVAEAIDCNTEYYGRLERGQGLPSAEMLTALMDALDVTADELLGDAIEALPRRTLLDMLSPKQRKLVTAITARGYEFIRLVLRVLDYSANREGLRPDDRQNDTDKAR